MVQVLPGIDWKECNWFSLTVIDAGGSPGSHQIQDILEAAEKGKWLGSGDGGGTSAWGAPGAGRACLEGDSAGTHDSPLLSFCFPLSMIDYCWKKSFRSSLIKIPPLCHWVKRHITDPDPGVGLEKPQVAPERLCGVLYSLVAAMMKTLA